MEAAHPLIDHDETRRWADAVAGQVRDELALQPEGELDLAHSFDSRAG